MIVEKYKKVGVGAWAAKALYDETVTALLINNFDDLRLFVNLFPQICQKYGGLSASKKLENAAQLLRHNNQDDLADQYIILSQEIRNYPIAPPCLNLQTIAKKYEPERMISLRIEGICKFIKCLQTQLEEVLKKNINSDIVPQHWYRQVSSIYSRAYQEWFTPFAINHLHQYLPPRKQEFLQPCLQVVDWSGQVWRCWRLLKNYPTLIDPGIFRPAQFFVWHIIHDSVHVWQMQAYGSDWSNILTPQDFLFLEAQAMCAERKALDLMLNGQLQIPDWYPSTNQAVILRLLIGILEREVRLHLDLSLSLYGQNIDDWLKTMCQLTGISSTYFLGFTTELLGMPGFASAYTSVTDYFMLMEDEQRKLLLRRSTDNLSTVCLSGLLDYNNFSS
ncbi:MAG TPA: hypothetical protein DD379_08295 [Cyanobacteria bacterium UBA11162]|nr:hypothetical protein [Cyanobacteria bacterium UBA11162]